MATAESVHIEGYPTQLFGCGVLLRSSEPDIKV